MSVLYDVEEGISPFLSQNDGACMKVLKTHQNQHRNKLGLRRHCPLTSHQDLAIFSMMAM